MTSAFARELRAARWPQGLSDLAAAGVTADMTRSRRWRRSVRGFFIPADTPFTTTQRILDVSPLIPPGGAVAGWAAAYALGVELLDGHDPFTMAALPVPIHLGRDLGRASPPGIRFARERLPTAHHQVLHGLPVTTPLRTMFDGGRWADGLTEAVVFLDQVAHALELDLDDLQPWCVPGARWPGIKQLRAALALADARTASPWESRLRMFYMLEARLPRPVVNRPVFDVDGRFLGTPDLFDPEAGLITEFDGKDHRMRRRHQADNIREEKLEGANLTVCRVDSLDLRQPVPLTERLRARHAQGMLRNRALDRWTLVEPPWWQRRRRAA
jgi:hypothetical protein